MPDDALSGTDKLHPRLTACFPRQYGSIGNNTNSKLEHAGGIDSCAVFLV